MSLHCLVTDMVKKIVRNLFQNCYFSESYIYMQRDRMLHDWCCVQNNTRLLLTFEHRVKNTATTWFEDIIGMPKLEG